MRVAISGDLDVTTAEALAQQLAEIAGLRPTGLVIDLSAVSYLDCAAARQLAGAQAVLAVGEPLVLVGVQPVVRRLLEVTGLAELFDLRD